MNIAIIFPMMLLMIFSQASAFTAEELYEEDIQKELELEENNVPDHAILLIFSNTSWSGAIIDGEQRSYTREGTGYAKFVLPCGEAGVISVNFQKQTSTGDLMVALIQNGKLINSAATSTQFGIAGVADKCLATVKDQEASSGGCLIATAAFGSEMAPQVQFLREIRDNTVMSTQSGASFMTAFNAFYYSFSPTVADLERQNPVFKEMVKATITPLITSLVLLQYVDIDTEEEMLGHGIGIILLNIGIYFVVPASIILKIKSNLRTKQV